jgi:tetratricopeptide (TPR) repeat protein
MKSRGETRPIKPEAVPEFSPLYGYVRALQLEGRYPEDVGIWPISASRVLFGWGLLTLDSWPHDPSREWFEWLQTEPPGLDLIAKKYRIGYYQRVRSSTEAANALLHGHAVSAAISVTDQFVDAADGQIEMPKSGDTFIGDHNVTLLGQHNGWIKFANSWGTCWGDRGFGHLPLEYFDRYLVEAFVYHPFRFATSTTDPKLDVFEWSAQSPLNHTINIIEVWDRPNDEREGWALAIERDGLLDIEDLFVRPAYRRRGVAVWLVRLLRRLSKLRQLRLRGWVALPDAEPMNFPAVQEISARLGLRLFPTSKPWARFVAAQTEADAGEREGSGLFESMADYTRVIEQLPGASVEQVAQALNNRGVAWGQNGDTEKALADYTRGIEQLPGASVEQVAQALNNRGVAWGQNGDTEKALADFTRVIEQLPDAPVEQVAQALNNRGVTWGQMTDTEKALADFTRVIEQLPDAPVEQMAQALNNRGVAWGQMTDTEKALADYTRVIEQLPDAPVEQVAQALAGRGWMGYLRGDLPGFLGDTEGALANLPTLDYATFNLGLALLACGRDGDAFAAYQRAGEMRPLAIDDGLADLTEAQKTWLSSERARPIVQLLDSLKST